MFTSILDRKRAFVLVSGIALSTGLSAAAETVPTIDTEDASLGSAPSAAGGRLHPAVAFDVRNGDFARGNYDDDGANLDRLPVHAQIGVAVELTHRSDGETASWFVLRSSNGFHAHDARETTAPRDWYESNNIAALVVTPIDGLRTGAVYTIKTSPNGGSATTHEASLSMAYGGDDAAGDLSPTVSVTVRPKGSDGVFTLAAIEPSQELSSGKGGPKLSVPLAIGVGWGGFYGARSGDRTFVSAGVALEQPFSLGDVRWTARVEALVLIRDDRLAALGGPEGETGRVVPLGTLSVSLAY